MPAPTPVTDQLTDAEKESVVRLFKDGYTQKEIADEFGKPRRTIMKLCKLLGLSRGVVEAAQLKNKSKLDNPDTIVEIRALREGGECLRVIAGLLDSSISAVERICTKNNIAKPQRMPLPVTDVVDSYESGERVKDIAKEHDCSEYLIYEVLRDAGVLDQAPMDNTNCVRRLKEERADEDLVVSDYGDLKSMSMVAAKHGYTVQGVKNILTRNGIVPTSTSDMFTGPGNPFFGKSHTEECRKLCAEIGSVEGRRFWLENPEYAGLVRDKMRELWSDLGRRKADSMRISELRRQGKCNSHRGEMLTRFGELSFDSSYEVGLIEICESDSRVVDVERDFACVEYDYNGPRTFVPDFRVWLRNGDCLVVEVKSNWYSRQPKERQKIMAGFSTFKDKFMVVEDDFTEFKRRIDLSFEPLDFNFNDLVLLPVESVDYLSFYGCFHYLGRSGRRGSTIGAYLNEKLVACCSFGSITRVEMAEKQGVSSSEARELTRFCVHPDHQKKNFGSWFLSRAVKWFIRENPNVKVLISFADTTQGHTGTIYKAAGWLHDGTTQPSYHYQDGLDVKHKKTIWEAARKAGRTETEEAELRGLKRVREAPKERFVYRNQG